MPFNTIGYIVVFGIYYAQTKGGIIQQYCTCYLDGVLVIKLVEKPEQG